MITEAEMLAAFKPSQRSLERASLKAILVGKLWACLSNTIFRWSWRFNGVRLGLMRAFGAKIVKNGVSVHPGARIEGPGNITIGSTSSIANHAWVYALDKISIGDRTCIGEYVKLLAGTHDITTSNFAFCTKPITIGSCVWIATGAMIMPGVTVGDGAVVGAGAVVTKDVAPWTVVGGNPARVIKMRELSV